MAKMDMDWNLKKLPQLFQVLFPRLQKSPINYYGSLLKKLFNPLSPNIHIQILQTDLYTFP